LRNSATITKTELTNTSDPRFLNDIFGLFLRQFFDPLDVQVASAPTANRRREKERTQPRRVRDPSHRAVDPIISRPANELKQA
jgi:hypothetical protein